MKIKCPEISPVISECMQTSVPIWQHKYFIIKGSNGYPGQVHAALFKNGKKVNGHNLIPNELTDKTFCFDTLKDMEAYHCNCGRKGCLYNLFLRKCVRNFRDNMHKL